MSGFENVEPSTSGGQKDEENGEAKERPSILVQKPVRGPFGSDYISPIKAGPFRAKYPPKKRKKVINFRENSESSSESIVTVLNDKKLKSLSSFSGRHLSSGDQESDCHIEVSFKNCGLRFTSGGETQNCWEVWRCLKRSRLCKILICLCFGIILPTLIIVPVLIIWGI